MGWLIDWVESVRQDTKQDTGVQEISGVPERACVSSAVTSYAILRRPRPVLKSPVSTQLFGRYQVDRLFVVSENHTIGFPGVGRGALFVEHIVHNSLRVAFKRIAPAASAC
jgi:hypothetical protein